VVYICCSGVKYMFIGQKLNVANLEDHMQCQAIASLLQNSHRSLLCLG
jgi:hypothetical protein